MPLKIFIDTEFTDFARPYLISLGMVSDVGEEFYAEIPYLYEECSDFVCETVLPLLGRYPDAVCSKAMLSERLQLWLEQMKADHDYLEICFDSQTDWDLFINALDYQVPKWCRGKPVGRNINDLRCCEFYTKNNLPEHHALYDAKANWFAYREEPDTTS